MKFKSEAEDWLSVLLWGTEKLLFPSWSKLFEPYEWWEYKEQMRYRFYRLERNGLVTREQRAGQLVYRITDLGRLEALGGRDPESRWRRRWDRRWRMVLFDLPASRRKVRQRFWRWLRDNGFGYLQNSVWIHPDPVAEVTDALDEFRDDVEMFTLMEARCCKGYSNEAVVRGAWDFVEINERYEQYIEVATTELARLRQPGNGNIKPHDLTRWLHRERQAWTRALWLDPLLPRALHPPDYLGPRALEARHKALKTVGRLLPMHGI
jgi:phenylacetic acid degradation operon negative regulatory protein